ncbi:hypothetical protein ACFS4T_14220 [Pseudomonas lini]
MLKARFWVGQCDYFQKKSDSAWLIQQTQNCVEVRFFVPVLPVKPALKRFFTQPGPKADARYLAYARKEQKGEGVATSGLLTHVRHAKEAMNIFL